MSKGDYYNILGVDRNADQSTIKKSYRSLCKEKHPDVGGNEEEFKIISWKHFANDFKQKIEHAW